MHTTVRQSRPLRCCNTINLFYARKSNGNAPALRCVGVHGQMQRFASDKARVQYKCKVLWVHCILESHLWSDHHLAGRCRTRSLARREGVVSLVDTGMPGSPHCFAHSIFHLSAGRNSTPLLLATHTPAWPGSCFYTHDSFAHLHKHKDRPAQACELAYTGM